MKLIHMSKTNTSKKIDFFTFLNDSNIDKKIYDPEFQKQLIEQCALEPFPEYTGENAYRKYKEYYYKILTTSVLLEHFREMAFNKLKELNEHIKNDKDTVQNSFVDDEDDEPHGNKGKKKVKIENEKNKKKKKSESDASNDDDEDANEDEVDDEDEVVDEDDVEDDDNEDDQVEEENEDYEDEESDEHNKRKKGKR